MVFIHPSDANVIQAGQVIPGTIMQPKMATQYTSHLQQNSRLGLWEDLRKADTRTLGGVQIIIGLIHIGFGSVSTVLWDEYILYTPLATYGAYPFWGGLFVQSSVGMNITSAIMALIGAILYITELIINLLDLDYNLTESVGFGLGLLLLICSLLEFCITVSTAHFGCRAACCKNDMTIVIVPYIAIRNDTISAEDIPAEASLSPPAHDNVAFCP